MGEVLAGRRDEYVLATKFGMEMKGAEAESAPAAPRGSREYLRWAVEGSLRRLRTLPASTSTSTTNPTA